MITVTFIDDTGERRSVAAQTGFTLMEVARQNHIPGIDAECGGACACATCHVYVDEAFMDKVGYPDRMEEDMLDFAFDVRKTSRLSCQISLQETHDGLVVTTPKKQG